MRVLVATTGFSGHVLPLAPFVRACVAAGHDVRAVAPAARRDVAASLGVPVVTLPDPAPDALGAVVAQAAALAPEQAHQLVVEAGFARLGAGTSACAALHVVDMWRPELVLHETLEFAAALAAERRGIPRVRVALGLAGGQDAELACAARGLVDLRAHLDLPADPDGAALRSSAWLSLTPPGLDDADGAGDVAGQRFRDDHGPAATPLPDWWHGSTAPLVYVSFGSIAGSANLPFFPALYRAALEALAGLPARILVTIGRDRTPADLGPVPANVHVERWVPQDDVLGEAAAVVTHGGYGSMLGALAHGVPLVVLPLFGGDQWINARRVEQVGAGVALLGDHGARRMLDLPAPSVLAELPGAVAGVLDDPRYGAAAGRIADEMRALPPADEAVGLLEQLAAGAHAAA